jgi:Holliday junction resolvase RusA-like endonuclease
VDSLVKPVLDALEQARVYIDDKQVRRLTVEKTDKGRGEPDWITVEVRENEV